MNARAELRQSRLRLQKVRDRLHQLKLAVDRLESKIEEGDYPSYQWESFKNDDLVRRAGHMREIDELEAKERELELDVTVWRNTVTP